MAPGLESAIAAMLISGRTSLLFWVAGKAAAWIVPFTGPYVKHDRAHRVARGEMRVEDRE